MNEKIKNTEYTNEDLDDVVGKYLLSCYYAGLAERSDLKNYYTQQVKEALTARIINGIKEGKSIDNIMGEITERLINTTYNFGELAKQDLEKNENMKNVER